MPAKILRLLVTALLFVSSAGYTPADDSWTCPKTGKTFKTGASPTPRHRLQAAKTFTHNGKAPAQCAYVPKTRSMFGNDRYGDCVSAEEAFAKSCIIVGVQPEIDIPESTVIAWARSHGVLNGAALDEVCDWMAQKGYQVGSQLYNDGPKQGVDYGNEDVLKAAIAKGPVKIAIAAGALPGGAGSHDGWFQLGSRSRNTDHCVSICGYGPAGWLYQQLNVPLPSGVTATTNGYLVYTWSTIGFVDHAWIMGTCDEAWVRSPTTIGVPPLVPPSPPTPPLPPTPPNPQPTIAAFTLDQVLQPGSYIVLPKLVP